MQLIGICLIGQTELSQSPLVRGMQPCEWRFVRSLTVSIPSHAGNAAQVSPKEQAQSSVSIPSHAGNAATDHQKCL
ncbi:hypothetical protein PRUB_a5373 [Pseudoalteromonas rubra]|uniref:Uncharacterized protein n=1 Tax=Pseudoalteromonas rubra TaxID=43658 RepID=A0A8T0CF54_9GAMM|nr:hypothetical protein PRUB_a5373 [Pseudoalteromonas rubra]